MSDSITKKNIDYYKKILQVVNEIDVIDKKLTKKYNRNQHELEILNEILQSSNNNFYTIVKNLQ
ncbi:hypothetical protein Klosneuvirus_1_214 [Klosneuvirus KNV1]|uniref:Uncharacterized protein n=1 Tax=Klosneuvirus KNV1 TaxID=1977640 RepID=A0A1V0SI13_9VIRU|nr:hypothetical protein Klosneuvirus_1_214 [Klosneuvirus KNV1]